MKILIVNRFFGGAQIPTGRMAEDVARVLVEGGHEVVALASTDTYAGAEKRAQHGACPPAPRAYGSERSREQGAAEQRPEGGALRVETVRVPKWMPRALAWLWFTWQARKRIPRMDWDVCILMTDPPLLPLLAAKAACGGNRGLARWPQGNRVTSDESGETEKLPEDRTTASPKHRATRRVVVWLMDLYPEALAASGRLGRNNLLYKWYFSKRQESLAAADLLICLGQAQKELLGGGRVERGAWSVEREAKGKEQKAKSGKLTELVRTAVVPPWDDREEVVRADDRQLENLALYAGNLGEAHCFEEILAAAPYLPGDWTIRFAARGAKLDALRAKASHREFSHGLRGLNADGVRAAAPTGLGGNAHTKVTLGARNASSDQEIAEAQERAASLLASSSFGLFGSLGATVEITGYASEEETPGLLASARVHLITMSPGWEGIVVPSKLYGCVRTGRPVLFIGPEDADTAREIRAHDWGKVLPPGASGEEVAGTILELAARETRATESRNGAVEVAELIQVLATAERSEP